MTPTQYRAGGANEDIRFAVGQSSLGAILVASSDKGVASILIGDDPDELVRDLEDRFPKARLVGGDKEYESMVVRVIGFVETPQISLSLPLDVRGTAFQRRVWQALAGYSATLLIAKTVRSRPPAFPDFKARSGVHAAAITVLLAPQSMSVRNALASPDKKKAPDMNILIVLTSHDRLGASDKKTGFWLEELAAPYYAFKDAGADVTLASPLGGQPPIDPRSDTAAFQTDDTRRFRGDRAAEASLANTAQIVRYLRRRL